MSDGRGPLSSGLEALALSGADRRVQRDLEERSYGPHPERRRLVVGAAIVLFVAGLALRTLVGDPPALVASF